MEYNHTKVVFFAWCQWCCFFVSLGVFLVYLIVSAAFLKLHQSSWGFGIFTVILTWPKGRRLEFLPNKKDSEGPEACSCHHLWTNPDLTQHSWGFSAKTERWVMEHGSPIIGACPSSFHTELAFYAAHQWTTQYGSIWMVGKHYQKLIQCPLVKEKGTTKVTKHFQRN